MDPRLASHPPEPERPYAPGESEFRTDLERIRFARVAFSRLAEVTQVVNAAATSGVVHNRLTPHDQGHRGRARYRQSGCRGPRIGTCFVILADLIMSWCRRRRMLMILVIRRSATSVSGSS